MSTPSLSAQARLAELLPLAIAEGWGVERLASEARVGVRAAVTAMRKRCGEMITASEQTGAGLLQRLQMEAALERPAVIARLKSAGSAADELLAKARELIGSLDATDDDSGEGDESGEPGPSARRGRSVTIESRLASLGTVVKAAASASKDCWAAFKDASGLAFAEETARASLKATGKGKPALVPDVLVELLPDGGRGE